MRPLRLGNAGNDLQQLSTKQARLLHASTALTSLWHAVEICELNSIEAGSSEVHVEVDTTSFSFKIVDNGHGLSAADFKHLGKWNISSKNSKSTHYVGIGLASVCSTAVVEIISRAAGSFETHSCLLRAGELVQLKLAAEQKTRSGTTIIARDMFFNRPVTRKSLTQARSNKEVEKCRDVLTGLALLRPDITFTLYDKGTRSFVLKHLKGRSQLQMVSGFFGNPHNPLENVAQLDNRPSNLGGNSNSNGWHVSGWAVRPPLGHPTPSRQRIFINNRAVKAPLLVNMIEEIFSELYRAVVKQDRGQFSSRGADLLSIQKANNQHAMFVLSLFCPPELVEILPEPGGGTVLVEDWTPVQEAVRHAMLAAWNPVLNTNLLNEAHEIMNVGGGGGGVDSILSGGLVARSIPQSIYPNSTTYRNYNGNNIRRSVSERAPSRAAATGANGVRNSSRREPQQQQLYRLPPQRLASTGSTLNRPTSNKFNGIESGSVDGALPSLLAPRNCDELSKSSNQQQPSLMASWRQRRELSRSRIASGFGSAAINLPPLKRPRSNNGSLADISQNKAIGLAHHSIQSNSQVYNAVGRGVSAAIGKDTLATNALSSSNSALDAILSSWKNPAMMPDTSTGTSHAILSLTCLSSAVFARLRPEGLEREDLQGARALHQVDSKFIPIVCNNGVLALVDQHAADERVQLEKLRAQTVAATGRPVNGACPSMQLPTPQKVRLGADEVPLLEAFGKVVYEWGWRWVTYPAPAAAPEVLIEVTAVPLIAQRALTATDMRLYLHDLAETNGGIGPPAGVVRVLNSRACRSAIMFGDELLPVQCQDLVNGLQLTQMCFICAHGRPTTAPVVDLKAVGKAAAVLQAAADKKKGRKGGSGGATQLAGLKDKLLAALRE